MKNKYFLVETDRFRDCPEVLEAFTNKKQAISACREKRRVKDAANALRSIEGSRERNANNYYIANTNKFEKSGMFEKLQREAIIF